MSRTGHRPHSYLFQSWNDFVSIILTGLLVVLPSLRNCRSPNFYTDLYLSHCCHGYVKIRRHLSSFSVQVRSETSYYFLSLVSAISGHYRWHASNFVEPTLKSWTYVTLRIVAWRDFFRQVDAPHVSRLAYAVCLIPCVVLNIPSFWEYQVCTCGAVA